MKNKVVVIALVFIFWGSNFSWAKVGSDSSFDNCSERFLTNIFIGPVLECEEFYIPEETLPPPDNDECEGATDLGEIGCSADFVFFESPEATPDEEATGNCIDNTTPGQWYTFTTPDPMPYTDISFNFGGVNVEIFTTESDCSALEYVDCLISNNWYSPEPGKTYYILSTNGFGLFTHGDNIYSCSGGPILNFNANNPYDTWSFTDCSIGSNLLPCENDNVRWYQYISGCAFTDLYLEASEYTGPSHPSALQIGISVFLEDCSTLASAYDINGTGYVCNALDGESLTLEDIPPETILYIAYGSEFENIGYFDLYMLETTDFEEVENDYCVNGEQVFEGVTTGLTNLCSSYLGGASEPGIVGCDMQFDATVWFEFDPGSELQDIEINVISNGIENPSIGVFTDCVPTGIGEYDCTGTINLLCVDYPIYIEVGSSSLEAGDFDLEITTNPSGGVVETEVTGEDVCSNSPVNILIDIPNGELVNIEVEVSPISNPLILGAVGQNFLGVNSAIIEDVLVSSSTLPQTVTYIITVNPLVNSCEIEPIEITITVYPEFIPNDISIEECLPHTLDLNIDDVMQGGSPPFNTVSWYWNTNELIATGEMLSYELSESGEITVDVVDVYGCEGSITIEVEIIESTMQTFDFPLEYCRSDQANIYFPTTSLELIDGTWEPPEINLENTPDGFHEIVFTPQEASCNAITPITIEIYSGIIPVFDLPESICADASEIVFPVLDNNGVLGFWDTPTFDPSSGTGIYFNIFTPDTEECAATFIHTFEVSDNVELNFDQPDSVCANANPFTLNDISENGYTGSWDNPIVDPETIAEASIVLIWTPLEGQSECIEETSITIYISQPLTPEFTLPNELCTTDPIFTFPDIDQQELSGTWTVTSIDPSIQQGSIQSMFVPLDECVESFNWEINIVEPISPIFVIYSSLCASDTILTLPTTSENGIQGNWSQPTIDPMTLSGQEVTVLFNGAALDTCIEPIEVTFDIQEPEIPHFNLPEVVCWLDSDIIFPTNSENSIEGMWTPSIIEIDTNLGDTITSTFTPMESICADEINHSVSIIAPYEVEIEVTDPSDCEIEDGSILVNFGQLENLEFSIDGGMSWQNTAEFDNLNSGGYTILIRATTAIDCVLEEEVFLNATDGPLINAIQSSDINNCIVYNGSITIDAAGNDLEYSIDGGTTWQISNEFNDLPPGVYSIYIRETNSDCIVEAEATIEDIVQTELVTINSQDISDCNVDDGHIIIEATGSSLEYSIDNGVTWSANNVFIDLPAGDYNIIIQSTIGEDCDIVSFAEISAPDMPEIIDIMIQAPTVCDIGVGMIEVDALGSNLEYSFDGGVTWQASNLLDNIPAGDYQVIVRDMDRIQCYIEEEVSIILIEEDLIESEISFNLPSDCELSDGSIEMSNIELDVEFSIDAGLTWQSINLFANLSAGIYTIITRKILFPDCNVEQSLEIPDVDCNCLDLIVEYDLEQMPCDDDESGIIDLTTIEGTDDPDLEILWNDGTTGPKLTEVGEGWYYYSINYDEYCIWTDSIFVEVETPITFDLRIDDSDCAGLNTGQIEVFNIEGGSGNYQYSIDEGLTFQAESIFTGLESGIYTLLVQDDANCVTLETIEVSAPEEIDVFLSDLEIITSGESIIIDPAVDPSKIDSFSWTPQIGIIDQNGVVIEVKPDETTTYTLELFYDDCYDSKSITIQLEETTGNIIFSNVFSPNGDGINDIFYIQGRSSTDVSINNMTIFDRWGNEVFFKMNPKIGDPSDGWDGSFGGKKVVSGCFVYMVSYIENGETLMEVGTITALN